jgi:hypothetical protein
MTRQIQIDVQQAWQFSIESTDERKCQAEESNGPVRQSQIDVQQNLAVFLALSLIFIGTIET